MQSKGQCPKQGVTFATSPGCSTRTFKKPTAVTGVAPTLRSKRDCTQVRKIALTQVHEIALSGSIDGAAGASNESKIALDGTFDGSAEASNVSKITHGGPIDGAAEASNVSKIAHGGPIEGAAEAYNESEIALGSPIDGAAAASNESEIALGGFIDVAAAAAHESKIVGLNDGAATTASVSKIALGGFSHAHDPPRLKDPLEIQATTPNRNAAASSLLSLLDDTDFNTEIEWTFNAKVDDDYYDDELYQDYPEDNYEEDMTYYRVWCNTGKMGCPLSAGGVLQPDLSGMTQAEAKETMRQWRVEHKAYTDKKEQDQRKRASLASNESRDIEYSGVLDERLQLMTDVEVSPMLIGCMFSTKEVRLVRIAEEANFCGCQIAIRRSDNFKVHAHGMRGLLFSIQATYSTSSG